MEFKVFYKYDRGEWLYDAPVTGIECEDYVIADSKDEALEIAKNTIIKDIGHSFCRTGIFRIAHDYIDDYVDGHMLFHVYDFRVVGQFPYYETDVIIETSVRWSANDMEEDEREYFQTLIDGNRQFCTPWIEIYKTDSSFRIMANGEGDIRLEVSSYFADLYDATCYAIPEGMEADREKLDALYDIVIQGDAQEETHEERIIKAKDYDIDEILNIIDEMVESTEDTIKEWDKEVSETVKYALENNLV